MAKISHWQHLGTTTLLKHPRMTVYEDDVTFPNGTLGRWLWFDSGSEVASVILRNTKGEILVSRQYCHPPRMDVYEFPGGMVDQDETPERAAQREAGEEVGVLPQAMVPLGNFLMNNRRSPRRLYLFLGTELERGTPHHEVEEAVTSLWLSERELCQRIRDGVGLSAVFLASWALYQNYMADLGSL